MTNYGNFGHITICSYTYKVMHWACPLPGSSCLCQSFFMLHVRMYDQIIA